MSLPFSLEHALDTARRAVEAAGAASLRYFQREVGVDWKQDGTPVTCADREAEEAVLAIIRREFPEHAILTEETGAHAGSAHTRWIVDPLDGTHRFARGLRFWGPLVALEHRGEVLVGAMAMPAVGEAYWSARGMGCYRNGARTRVSTVMDWKASNVSLGAVSRLLATAQREGVLSLIETASYAVSGNDLGGCALVLAGQAEAWLESGVKVWDVAPFKSLVEEAGGRFTNLVGEPTIESGAAVASNGALHEHVLKALNPERR